MRRSVTTCLTAVLFVLTASACGGRAAGVTEQAGREAGPGRGIAFAKLDYDGALARAKSEKKLVMLDVYTDWCGWCKKLDREVFADDRVAAATTGLVAVRVNAEDGGERVAERFGVEGFPTILFVDAEGNLVKRIDGYVDRDEMLAVLAKLPKT